MIKFESPTHIALLTGTNVQGFLLAALITITPVWVLSALSFRFVEKHGIEFGKWLLSGKQARVPGTRGFEAR